jgi:PLP dependent protein
MSLAENIQQVQKRIAAVCERSGRNPAEILLLGVTKSHPPEMVREAVELGLRDFGENKVQEAKAKIPLCPGSARWQMIGHLQSNKVRDAVYLFQTIQSVDSLALAREIDKWAGKMSKTVPLLLEVNVSGESSKHGFQPEAVLGQLLEVNALPHIEIHGLMTMAPWTPEPEKVRPIFRHLRAIKLQCEEKLGAPLPVLSMGMSGDFEVAIEEGSTCVRVGAALFGLRPGSKRN